MTRTLPDIFWRVGVSEAPLSFVPRDHCGWNHRFDDPKRQFRTLYCAQEKVTCLREVLADLRPDTKTLAEFDQIFGEGASKQIPVGHVRTAWRKANVLAPTIIELDQGELVDVDQVGTRIQLERQHAALLAEHGMSRLNISDIRSTNRIVTKTIARSLSNKALLGCIFVQTKTICPAWWSSKDGAN